MVHKYGFLFHVHDNDTQVYIGLYLRMVNLCYINWNFASMRFVPGWLDISLNPMMTKIELMITSSKIMQKWTWTAVFSYLININKGSKTVRNLGTMMDYVINMKAHITSICKSAYFQLHNVGAIGQYLTKDVGAQLMQSFVTSRLEYCNTLIHEVSIKSSKRLRKVHNTVQGS